LFTAVRNDRNKKKKKKILEECSVSVEPSNELTDVEQQLISQIEEAHISSFPLTLSEDHDSQKVGVLVFIFTITNSSFVQIPFLFIFCLIGLAKCKNRLC